MQSVIRRIAGLFPLFYFGFFTILSCFKVGRLLRLEESSGPDQILELLRAVFITLFFYMIIFSYLMRSEARIKAEGILERYLPLLLTVGIPVYFSVLLRQRGLPPLPLYLIGLLTTIYGWVLSIRALWFLKYSFSIMAEVRELVTAGPYRTVRHPLYFAEMMILAGLTMMVFSPGALAGLVTSTTLQVIRARIEESKMLRAFPEDYPSYKDSTGFFLPPLNRRTHIRVPAAVIPAS
jgi:protein-S-isoprenylcysteine O-methyltransferase Ste14